MLKLISLFFFVFIFLFPRSAFAHPGRTAADGCHYCRTRCDYWGVPWNQRHCHGGSPVQPAPKIVATPTPSPTPKPTAIPTPIPTPTPSPTPTPTFEPEVKGEEIEELPPTEPPISATEADAASTENSLLGLGIFGAVGVGAFWLIRHWLKG